MINADKVYKTSNAFLSTLYLMLADEKEWGNFVEILSALQYASEKFQKAALNLGILDVDKLDYIRNEMVAAAGKDLDLNLIEKLKNILEEEDENK